LSAYLKVHFDEKSEKSVEKIRKFTKKWHCLALCGTVLALAVDGRSIRSIFKVLSCRNRKLTPSGKIGRLALLF